MKLEAEEKHRLRDLFVTQLQKCEQVPAAFSPSKHRSTQIDTEKVLKGTSDTPSALASLPCQHQKKAIGSRHAAAAASIRIRSTGGYKARAPASGKVSAAELESVACTLYQSDFAAGAAAAVAANGGSLLQHSPARLAAARRALESYSEWAELNKLELIRTQQEAVTRQLARQQQQLQHRHQLDQQVSEHTKQQLAAAAAKLNDLAVAVADVAAHAEEQAAKQAAAKQAADKVRQERQQQVVAAEAAWARAAAKKSPEYAALLASVQRQIAAAQAAAAAKAADARRAADEAKAANVRAQEAKRREAQEQQQRDEHLMQETIRTTTQRQEEAREAALKAFHDKIAARAVVAGATVVAESRARQEREDRLVAASTAKANADAEARHAADMAKRAAQAADRKAAAAAAAAAKAATQQAALAEQARLRSQVQADLAEHEKSEQLSAQQRHERNLAHAKFLEQQIVQAEERALLDDVFMDPKERELNRRLLSAARSALGSVGHA